MTFDPSNALHFGQGFFLANLVAIGDFLSIWPLVEGSNQTEDNKSSDTDDEGSNQTKDNKSSHTNNIGSNQTEDDEVSNQTEDDKGSDQVEDDEGGNTNERGFCDLSNSNVSSSGQQDVPQKWVK